MAVWKGNADSTVRDKINASETAIVDLISIKDALEAYMPLDEILEYCSEVLRKLQMLCEIQQTQD